VCVCVCVRVRVRVRVCVCREREREREKERERETQSTCIPGARGIVQLEEGDVEGCLALNNGENIKDACNEH